VVNRPSVPEIITVNSEELQSQIRDLLPSQNGFGSELQASNVITPIIDLTATAEGSSTPTFLQQAISFGSATAFNIQATTTTLANSPGFWRFRGLSNLRGGNSPSLSYFEMSDGLSTKIFWEHYINTSTTTTFDAKEFDFIVFLRAGDSVAGRGVVAGSPLDGIYYQVADGSGTLVNPVGFPV
jgi:hypothetical protein